MWLHFVRAPAPAAPALLLLRRRRRLPPARPPARGRRRLGRAPPSSRELRPGSGGASSAPRPARRRTERRAAGRLAGRERCTDRLPRCCCCCCCCPARRRRRGPLTGWLAPSAALTHVLLTEQNPNYSPALPPTSATLSHWAAGLFRRNNKTCQSGEGQRVTETRLGGRGARRAAERARTGKAGGRGRGTDEKGPRWRGGRGQRARAQARNHTCLPGARGRVEPTPEGPGGSPSPTQRADPRETYFPRNGSLPVRVKESSCRREVDFTLVQKAGVVFNSRDCRLQNPGGSGKQFLPEYCLLNPIFAPVNPRVHCVEQAIQRCSSVAGGYRSHPWFAEMKKTF